MQERQGGQCKGQEKSINEEEAGVGKTQSRENWQGARMLEC